MILKHGSVVPLHVKVIKLRKMVFTRQIAKNWLPLWKYLNQPISLKMVLNPVHFWYLYRIEYLERCLNKDREYEGPHRY
jgi:hypothetical protein